MEHPELNAVWSGLIRFTGGGSIVFKDPRFYTALGEPTTFAELMEAAHARGETALGWRIKGRTHLSPVSQTADGNEDERHTPLVFGEGDGVVVIAPDRVHAGDLR